MPTTFQGPTTSSDSIPDVTTSDGGNSPPMDAVNTWPMVLPQPRQKLIDPSVPCACTSHVVRALEKTLDPRYVPDTLSPNGMHSSHPALSRKDMKGSVQSAGSSRAPLADGCGTASSSQAPTSDTVTQGSMIPDIPRETTGHLVVSEVENGSTPKKTRNLVRVGQKHGDSHERSFYALDRSPWSTKKIFCRLGRTVRAYALSVRCNYEPDSVILLGLRWLASSTGTVPSRK